MQVKEGVGAHKYHFFYLNIANLARRFEVLSRIIRFQLFSFLLLSQELVLIISILQSENGGSLMLKEADGRFHLHGIFVFFFKADFK
jgi:hypothetical protein